MQAQAQGQVGNPGTPQMGMQNIQGVVSFPWESLPISKYLLTKSEATFREVT